MKYLSVIDVNNKNNSHTIAIDLLGNHSKGRSLRILEVGCSAGYLGSYLKTLGHTVIGVEMDPISAREAAECLDAVYCQSIQSYYSENPLEKFDAIFFGDVLEHIANPDEVLISTHDFLNKDGIVIASIPNVAHHAIRAMLLEGSWDYSDLGILDRTHLQFFTKSSLHELFKKSHYNVIDSGEVHLSVQQVSSMCNLELKPDAVELVEEHYSDDKTGSVFQFIFAAKPQKERLTRVVAYVPDKEITLCKIRIKDPLSFWENNYPGQFRYRSFGEVSFEDFYWGDVFIFQRLGDANVLRLVQSLVRYGKKVIFEIDDLLTEIPEFLSHHEFSERNLQIFHEVLESVDLITTTTDRLSGELAKVNKNVFVIPNCVTPTHLGVSTHSDSSEVIELIVASSDTVRVDFIVPALMALTRDYPGRFHITAIGPPGEYLEKVGVPVHRKPILSQKEFKEFLSNLSNPIGLIPLEDSLFSSCKSPIKFFDYALAGVPSVCSNVPPYADYVKNRETGLLVNNDVDSWVSGILELSNSADLRNSLVQNACRFVNESYTIDHAAASWERAFDSLDIQRVVSTEKLDIDDRQSKLKFAAANLLRHLVSPKSYRTAYLLLRNMGFKEFKSTMIAKIKIFRA